jgi:hypothetical protein
MRRSASASPVGSVNEFYKKGCQEKSSASTGGLRFFLEIPRQTQSEHFIAEFDCPWPRKSSSNLATPASVILQPIG